MKNRRSIQNATISLLAIAVSMGAAASERGAAQLIAKPWTRGAGPADTSTWVGSNYTPAYASNQIQMWHDFRPDVIEKELAAARRIFGFTSLRVFLHHMVYDAEREILLQRIEQFLQICDRHNIKPGFVFFDDCHRRKGVTLEPQPAIKGYCNGRWAALQDVDHSEENFPKFKNFVQDIVRAHHKDPRVLWWEVYNEPEFAHTPEGRIPLPFQEKLRGAAYAWALECEPIQPVLSNWTDNPHTEIVDVHKYGWGPWDSEVDINPAKGSFFTEAGARWRPPRMPDGEPCEVIKWLQDRRAAGKAVPGVMLAWELMIGDSNCRWIQGTSAFSPEPTIPWCGLLWPDGSPFSLAEVEAIRHYTTGERRALLYEDFQAPAPDLPRGWIDYQVGVAPPPVRFPPNNRLEKLKSRGSLPEVSTTTAGFLPKTQTGVCIVPPGREIVAGEAGWSNYVMEAVIMLRDYRSEAGLMLRVNKPNSDQMQGYYVSLDVEKLTLTKIQDGRKELKTYDHVASMECKVVPDEWNQLRVAVDGNRIRVWLNRMHPTADPANGLRIDFVDKENPVLSGSVGLRAVNGEAWFDNAVVLSGGDERR